MYTGFSSIDPFPNALYVFAENGRKQYSNILCNAKYEKDNKILYASSNIQGTYNIYLYGIYQFSAEE